MSEEKKTGVMKYVPDLLKLLTSAAVIGALAAFNTELGTWLSTRTNNSLSYGFIALVAAIIMLLWLYLGSRPWLTWDEPTGTWLRKSNGMRYCAKCRTTSGKYSPLKNENTGWRCMSCERFFFDPARPSKDTTPRKLISAVRTRV